MRLLVKSCCFILWINGSRRCWIYGCWTVWDGFCSAVGGIVCGVGTRWYCNREDITEYDKTVQAAAKTFGYGNVGVNDLLMDKKILIYKY